MPVPFPASVPGGGLGDGTGVGVDQMRCLDLGFAPRRCRPGWVTRCLLLTHRWCPGGCTCFDCPEAHCPYLPTVHGRYLPLWPAAGARTHLAELVGSVPSPQPRPPVVGQAYHAHHDVPGACHHHECTRQCVQARGVAVVRGDSATHGSLHVSLLTCCCKGGRPCAALNLVPVTVADAVAHPRPATAMAGARWFPRCASGRDLARLVHAVANSSAYPFALSFVEGLRANCDKPLEAGYQ